jgi:hypothetical protein
LRHFYFEEAFAVARQPITKVYPRYQQFNLRFGVGAVTHEPELSLIGEIISKWSYVETEMAVVLGCL